MSRIMSFIAGAVSVGAVVAILVISGVLDTGSTTTQSTSPIATATAAPTTTVSTPAPAHSVAGIYQRVSKGVVFVENDQGGQEAASGSGFVIDSAGHVVTNEHVVENGTSFRVRFGENGDPIPAKLLGADKSNDLAVLQIDPSKVGGALQPVQLGDSNSLQPGQPTIAIGSPFGLEGTVTSGIVSAVNRTIQAPNGFSISGAIQTDAAINPGNSGGPLLDAQGRVIGVNSQIASSSGSNTGVGFAIPVDSIRNVVPKLLKDGHIDRAYLGLASGESPSAPGALVGTINPGTAAADAGIKTGDLIVGFDGKTVRSPSELSLDVLQKQPGDSVKVELKRGNSTQTVTVKLGRRPNQAAQ
jgi:putative serine protease PepD